MFFFLCNYGFRFGIAENNSFFICVLYMALEIKFVYMAEQFSQNYYHAFVEKQKNKEKKNNC